MKSCILFLVVGLFAVRCAAQIPTPSPLTLGASQNGVVSPATAAAAAEDAGTGKAGVNGFVADANYQLRPGDAVSFQIKEDIIWNPLDLPKVLTVADSGELEIPYIGRVSAVNKTCKQVADEITTNLLETYYNKATVALSLNVANRVYGRIYIWGAVRAQGPIQMDVAEHLTASEAIMKAGGFSDFADKSSVKLLRPQPGSPKDKIISLDMHQILDKGKTEQDVLIEPGDHILVSSKFFNF